ncbi:uncharacterized protein BX663DRAFT_487620 [Cokeromyces recurvatus]|uniref:uncharacterized protein n=1 Tax=Cokeromyces recurvatus TaxID=90255 RepID=UPI00222110CE|nr:uncharacterized protein BX663DRAFT_487620 [Cokeromyces recurvatus]KAI7901474.1 hypothetical protein BX663DRAFT_487620 [Cokeromyces recurvatus]
MTEQKVQHKITLDRNKDIVALHIEQDLPTQSLLPIRSRKDWNLFEYPAPLCHTPEQIMFLVDDMLKMNMTVMIMDFEILVALLVLLNGLAALLIRIISTIVKSVTVECNPEYNNIHIIYYNLLLV